MLLGGIGLRAVLTVAPLLIGGVTALVTPDYKARAKDLTAEVEAVKDARDADKAVSDVLLSMAKALGRIREDQSIALLGLDELLERPAKKGADVCSPDMRLP